MVVAPDTDNKLSDESRHLGSADSLLDNPPENVVNDRHSLALPEFFGDTERTEMRYKNAVIQLKQLLSVSHTDWEAFDVLKLDDITEIDFVPELIKQINKLLDVRRSTIESQDWWSKGKRVIENTFKAISPLVQNILQIVKEGQSVCRAACIC